MFSVGLKTAAVTSALFLISAEVAFGQTFNVNDSAYGASGSANTGTCSGQAGSSILTDCQTGVYDWKVGQVIRIVGGGPPPSSRAYSRFNPGVPLSPEQSKGVTTILINNIVNGGKLPKTTTGASGLSGHLYCYSVSISDPLQGISAPSPVTCDPSGQPNSDLSITNFNSLYAAAPNGVDWLSPIFLWYVSKDKGSFQLLAATQARNEGDPGDNVDSGVNDLGQAFPAQFPSPMLPSAKATLTSRGGWPQIVTTNDPTTIPPDVSRNEDMFAIITAINGNQVTIDCPPNVTPFQDRSNCILGSTITAAKANIFHDDTYAVQMAVDAAASAGGGTVQFGAGIYNIQQPSVASNELTDTGSVDYPNYTTNISKVTNYNGFSFLHIKVPAGRKGNVHLAGLGSSTILQTPPDQAGWANLFDIGNFARADGIVGGVIGINPVEKGSTQVSLASGSASTSLRGGDDVLLFSGSFGSPNGNFPCPLQQTGGGVSAGDCHYTELNTIASIAEGGTTYNLVYPASKNFFAADGGKSSFGMVKMRDRTPHNIMLYNMALNTYDHIFGTGNVYGLTVDAVQVNGYIDGGAFNGGYKRDVILKNSTWGVGRGDLSYSSEEEYDKFTNLQILNNAIYGFAPIGSAGPSQQARLSTTEGTSQVTYYSNSFNDISLYFDQTTDDIVDTNNFYNGIITMGVYYGATSQYWDYHDPSYASFGSQTYARITNNQFTIGSSYLVPWVIRLGHFDSATLSNNTINYMVSSAGGPGPGGHGEIIFANSGLISNNVISLQSATSVDAIIALPDAIVSMLGQPVSQPSSLSILNNTINAPSLDAGILIPDPGFVDTVPICVAGNNVALVVRAAPGQVTLSCP